MASGSKEGESYIFSYLLVLSCLDPCMLVPCRPYRLLGSCGDNRTAKNPGDVLVHLVHQGRGTLQFIWALMFFCVSLLSNALSFAITCVLGEVDSLCSSLHHSTLSWFLSISMAWGLRENGTSLACSPFGPRQSP
jgi:hypothetical protein